MVTQTLDTTSCSAVRISFLALLLAQMNVPLYPTYFDYVYPSNYLNNAGSCTFYILGICVSYLPSACKGSQANTLPTFDYIVVGAGPTGITIAYRLALKNAARKVLLIEAGDKPDIDVMPPTWFPFNLGISSDYKYKAEYKAMTLTDSATNNSAILRTEITGDRYGLGYTGGLPCSCGKALGGGSAMNAMMFVCGTSQDYEGWKTSTGTAGWGWGTGANNDGMWAYYKKVMKMDDPALPSTCANYYGTTGPLYVTNSNSTSTMIPILQAAATQSGYPLLADINCGKWIGLANVHATIKKKERNHAARAMLAPLWQRNNLMVMRGSTVTKINLVGTLGGTVTATGVTVRTTDTNCSTIILKAGREIVISAGAFNSPKILLQSGIGRAPDLTPFSITQRINRPVGYNLQDHPFSLHFIKINATTEEIAAAGTVNQISILAAQATDYLNLRTGPFTFVGNMMQNAFFNTNDPANNPNGFPNMQWIFYTFDYQQAEMNSILTEKFALKQEYASQILAANQNHKILMAFNILLNPKSRGIVRLAGADPLLAPKIYTNYFTDPTNYDQTTIIQGIGRLNAFLGSSAMQNVSASILQFNITECNPLTYGSDAYWACYFKYFVQNLWHPAGTCKMGTAADTTSVVDPTLRVHGITGTVKVRVADASIMPQITSGNTQCPCYAIGEKAADMIIAANP